MSAFVKNATLTSLFIGLYFISISQNLELKRVESSVFFKFNQHELSSDAKQVIDNLFPWESNFYPEKVSLIGYTDNKGSASYNKALAQKRAASVQAYISDNHLSNTEFEAIHIGEEQPAYDCNPSMNRCVKITMFLKQKEQPVSLERCKELFPEEFTVTEIIAEEKKSMAIATASIEPEYPETEQVLEDNKFQEKVADENIEMITLNDILFYGNSDRYFKSAVPELEQLAAFLVANDSYSITITGHVNGGKNSSRQLRKETEFQDVYELSLARADAIKLFLIEKGIDTNRITAVGKGGEELLFPNPQSQAESEANRRIEITFHTLEN